jgi:hypothetical protein
MARRSRSEAEKAHRRAHERLVSLQKKVDEFNMLTTGKMCLVWEYNTDTSTFGERELFDQLSRPGIRIRHQIRRRGLASFSKRPVSESSDEANTQTSPEILSFGSKKPLNPSFEEKEPAIPLFENKKLVLAPNPTQHESPMIDPVHCGGWRRESLDLLALNFFGD